MSGYDGMSVGWRKDYDFHYPYKLRNDAKYEKDLAECIACVKDGMSPQDACMMVFDINQSQFNRWLRHAEEDIIAGFTEEDSRLIELMIKIGREELNLRRRLERRANKLALTESNDMLKFLLERRHGYTKQTQKDIEVSTKEEAPIKFEFVDMKPTENED